MTTEEFRRQNARALAAATGGLSNFARRMGMSISQVSQNIGRTPTRNIGAAMARSIEKEFGKPVGWMDYLHEELPAPEINDELGLGGEVTTAKLAEAVKKVRDPAQRKALVTMLRAFGVLESD